MEKKKRKQNGAGCASSRFGGKFGLRDHMTWTTTTAGRFFGDIFGVEIADLKGTKKAR